MSDMNETLLEAVMDLRIKAAARDRVVKLLCRLATDADPVGWLEQIVGELERLDEIADADGTIAAMKEHIRYLTTDPA